MRSMDSLFRLLFGVFTVPPLYLNTCLQIDDCFLRFESLILYKDSKNRGLKSGGALHEKKQFRRHGIGNCKRHTLCVGYVYGSDPGMGCIHARNRIRLHRFADGFDHPACVAKMEHKKPVHISGKVLLTTIAGIVGALALGTGMCFCMVWGHMIAGIVIGLVGIVILIGLIPLTKGLKG